MSETLDGSIRDPLGGGSDARTVGRFPHQACGSHCGPRWYVVQTVPGREARVAARLKVAGFETLLPTVVVERVRERMRWGRIYRETRRRTVLAFPGYLLVLFDVREQRWRTIHSTREVRRLFSSSAERPLPVPDREMRGLLDGGRDKPMADETAKPEIQVGATVEVQEGPFASFLGVCLLSSEDRVQLLLSLFGRETKVDLPVGHVALVDAGARR